jgi:hypothetical protein
LPGAGAPHGAFSILPGQRQQRLIDNLSSKLWTDELDANLWGLGFLSGV